VILLWGTSNDEPLALVLAELQKRGAQWILADQDKPLAVVAVHDQPGALVAIDGKQIDLNSLTAAYLRPQQRVIGTFDQVLMAWADATAHTLIVNRPAAMSANACKPFQARWVQRHGFAVPATILTTSAQEVRAFKAQHSQVIYKSISGVRSIVTRLRDDRSLDNLQYCPTQFQEYVSGTDYRAHLVGDALFSCRIESDADDYRYPSGERPILSEARLPVEVGARLRAMVTDMGLYLAGVDLRLTPAGEWFCFEVNPSPGYSYFSNATGQPIAAAIADILITGGTYT
jgi:glutathione synthase/RimK-type ligase-like ATP-grasp enzyme